MGFERLLMLCSLSVDGVITAGWSALCERCVKLDGPATTRTYNAMLRVAEGLRECGVGDDCVVVCHHDRVEVRYGPTVSLERLAFLQWETAVEYRAADDTMQKCWH